MGLLVFFNDSQHNILGPIKFHDLLKHSREDKASNEGCNSSPTGHDFKDKFTMSRSLIFKMNNR